MMNNGDCTPEAGPKAYRKSWDDLPNELQLQIVGYCVQFNSPITWKTHEIHSRRILLSLLLANRKLNEQATEAYSRNAFQLETSHKRTGGDYRWKYPKISFARHTRHLVIRMLIPNKYFPTLGWDWLIDDRMQWPYMFECVEHLVIKITIQDFVNRTFEDTHGDIIQFEQLLAHRRLPFSLKTVHVVLESSKVMCCAHHGSIACSFGTRGADCANSSAQKLANAVRDMAIRK